MAKTPAKTSAAKKAPMKKRKPLKPDADGVVRLSGGNPQIAKGDGDAVVQAFIKAMPGWTKEIGAKIDKVGSRVVPKAAKAVRSAPATAMAASVAHARTGVSAASANRLLPNRQNWRL
mgnify:CR=1 FL=1